MEFEISENVTAEELQRKFIKEETKRRANTLNSVFKSTDGTDEKKLEDLNVDVSSHMAEILQLKVTTVGKKREIGDFGSDDEFEAANFETVIQIEESEDEDEDKDENVFTKIRRTRVKQTRLQVQPRPQRRSRRRGVKRPRSYGVKSPPKKKHTGLLGRILNKAGAEDRGRKRNQPIVEKNRFAKKITERYKTDNMSMEEQEKRKAEEREERAKKRKQRLVQESQRRQFNPDEKQESDEDYDEDDNGEEMIVRIQRPPNRRRRKPGKTHTTVKMASRVPFKLVLDQLKEKWEVDEMILMFDGEKIDPEHTPEQAGIEDGDQLDCSFPSGEE